MVEPRRVGEHRRPGAHLHAVGLEDGDDRGGRAGARGVLLVDALALAARDVGVDGGRPGGEGLAVAAVQAVVEGLLGGRQGGEGRLDVGGQIVPNGHAEQWRVAEDSRSAGDVGGCDAAVAFVWEGADLVERVVWRSFGSDRCEWGGGIPGATGTVSGGDMVALSMSVVAVELRVEGTNA